LTDGRERPTVPIVIRMFAFGSNMGSRGLAAKGVVARASRPARLEGHELRFDVPSVFRRVEGGVADVVPAAGQLVHGVLHDIEDEQLPRLDALEGTGMLYDRHAVTVTTYDGDVVDTEVYIGVDGIRDPSLRPSSRYIRILCAGAAEHGIDPAWIAHLHTFPQHEPARRGVFTPPPHATLEFDAAGLAGHTSFVALHGVVFDLSDARAEHVLITRLVGGRDLTPMMLAMTGAGLDASEASRQLQIAGLHELQHDLALDYPVVGRFIE
jgi:gamma-glutamyl AIG2-like cyclotransferase